MKVTNNICNVFVESAKSPSEKSKPGQSFSDLLAQVARGSEEGSSGLKSGTGLPPLGGLDPVTLSGSVTPLSQSGGETVAGAGLIDELETILGTFDHYRMKLGDVSVPVDDLADLIGHLEDRIGRLQALNASATTPGGLKEVTSSLMITIATEIEKYKRGDYV